MAKNPEKQAKRLNRALENERDARDLVSRTRQRNLFGLPDRCPVVPLGVHGDRRYYLDIKGQLICLAARDHSRLNINGLFGELSDFVMSVPEWTRRTDEGTITGWRPERVANALIAACNQAGVWDPTQYERGRGAWLGPENELILHTGDKILIHGTYDPWGLRQEQEPGQIGRHVYPRAEAITRPAEREDLTPNQAADTVLATLETWQWRRPELDPVLLLGWIAAAMIGGALAWRPVIWLSGGRGTGKSTLQRAIAHLLGGHILAVANTSAAGIWQTLQKQTLPVSVDELEATEDNKRASEIITLARIAASGGKMVRGSDRHISHEFTLQNCFMFSSILVPPLLGPDRSRICILDLDELDPRAPEPNLNERRLNHFGAAIRKNLVLGWKRFSETLARYRGALAEDGTSKRGADQFGTLLTCADLALYGATADHGSAHEWIPAMLRRAAEDAGTDESKDEDQCLQHLLGAQVDVHRSGIKTNIGEWINRGLGRCDDWDDPKAAQKTLVGLGIRIETILPTGPAGRPSTWVCIANTHAALQSLFEKSRWQTPRGVTGVWAQSLRRLPGAERSTAALYFGGPISRAILLPIDVIPVPDNQEKRPIFDAQMR
jgi:hypothetical protein